MDTAPGKQWGLRVLPASLLLFSGQCLLVHSDLGRGHLVGPLQVDLHILLLRRDVDWQLEPPNKSVLFPSISLTGPLPLLSLEAVLYLPVSMAAVTRVIG